MGAGQLEAGEVESAWHAAGADDDLRGVEAWGVLALDHVRFGEPRGAGVLVKRDSGLLELFSQQRVRADVAGHLADAIEQPRVVERGFAGGDAVARELPGFAHQACGVRQRADGHRSVVGGHAPELIARDQRGPGPESRRAKRRHHPGGSGTDHHHIVVRGAR